MPIVKTVYEWHDECDLELQGVPSHDGGVRTYWCAKHNQWTYEWPVKVVYTYADGSTFEPGGARGRT